MCGIAGSFRHPLDYPKLRKSLLHRGPDAQQGFRDGELDLYHLRLAIQDIQSGAQPMHLHNRYTIVFNGEIYNHRELRNRFGLTGQTQSDTETLLLLYEKLGPAFLHETDGMFALAIYDREDQTLFMSRDRAGKKPLYYFKHEEKFLFASELNAIASQIRLDIHPEAFYPYFRLGVFYRRLTPYRHVEELPAGSSLTLNLKNGHLKEERWWDIHDYYLKESRLTFQDALVETDMKLKTSVQRRLESSDLEVGCFLSGGIDSGLITAIASNINPRLKTFTVSFDGEYDEAPLAKRVAEKYQTHHTEIKISFGNLEQDIEKILMNYGEPYFDSSAIPSYYVSQEAKKHLTVILNGDGADELFGGYRRYVPFARYDFFNTSAAIQKLAQTAKAIIPPSDEKKSKLNFLFRLASFASKKGPNVYFSAGLDIIEDFENQIIADPGVLRFIETDFNRIAKSPMSGLKKIMNMDFDTNLFSDLLVKMDIATMAHSLEGRSPFLGKELLEYAPTLPDHYKIKGGSTKFLLRTLAARYLPESLVHQPKRGFEIPLKQWIDGQLHDVIRDYLTSPGALFPDFVKPQFVHDLLNKKAKVPAEKRAKIIWTLFCLEVWYKKIYLA